eukprot:g12231.t1
MKRRVSAILSFSALLLASTPYAPPANAQVTELSPIRDQDQAAYEELFREKLTSVQRTRSSSDDKTLANDMMAFAQSIPDDQGVQCLIYIETITLASNASDLSLMRQANRLLETSWPKQDAVCPEQLMQLASQAFRGVDRSEREEQGEQYINLLRDVATKYENQDDFEQAISVCRLASTIARTLGSDQLDTINTKIKSLSEAKEINNRIEMLKLSVQKNPQNSPAARDLVQLLITRQNDPLQAARFVDLTQDEELTDLVSRCALGIEQANAATAMRIADWYLSLAEDQPDKQAVTLLLESRRWYARFVAQYRRDDALAKRVQEMDQLARGLITKLGGKASADADIDGWFSLIKPPFNPSDYSTRETAYQRDQNDGLMFTQGAFFVPYEKAQAYEIRLRLTLHDTQNNVSPVRVHLPLSDRVLTTYFFIDNTRIAYVDAINEEQLISPSPGKIGQAFELTFQVAMSKEQVAFAMLYNGKPALRWQGELIELRPINRALLEQLETDIDHAMYLDCPSNLTLHALDYRVRK